MTDQEISDRTADLLSLNQVKRWGIVKTIVDQSVAEHSFNVAIIAAELAERLSFNKEYVLWWALTHDAPESMTGDIDGRFKRDNPNIKAAITAAEDQSFPWYRSGRPGDTTAQYHIVKVADGIETTSFIQRWGCGPKDDDIYHELNNVLFSSLVPRLCTAMGAGEDESVAIVKVVRDILHRSVMESNTIQMRRHRGRYQCY